MPVRVASPTEVDAILACDGPILGLSAERARELVAGAVASASCLVHDDGSGAVEGYAVVEPRGFFGRDFVKLLVVAPTRRRRGIGTALLGAAGAGAGTSRVFTSTNQSNAAMHALLARCGWEQSGTLVGIDEGDPEVVYYRDAPSLPG